MCGELPWRSGVCICVMAGDEAILLILVGGGGEGMGRVVVVGWMVASLALAVRIVEGAFFQMIADDIFRRKSTLRCTDAVGMYISSGRSRLASNCIRMCRGRSFVR